jgi:hypothetical protein
VIPGSFLLLLLLLLLRLNVFLIPFSCRMHVFFSFCESDEAIIVSVSFDIIVCHHSSSKAVLFNRNGVLRVLCRAVRSLRWMKSRFSKRLTASKVPNFRLADGHSHFCTFSESNTTALKCILN